MTMASWLRGGLLLAAVLLGACTPIPEDFGQSSGVGSSGATSPTPSASVGVTHEGSTVRIVGLGATTSDKFELPAGNATMAISACTSGTERPFITLYDESGVSKGLIVDPEKQLKNLTGGTYYVLAQANPDCVWTVEITPG